MLNYFDALDEWVDHRLAEADESVTIRARRGPENRPTTSADVGFESDERLGVVAVWENGAVEAEVLEIASMARPLVVSTVVADTSDLFKVLEAVWQAMKGHP